MVWRFLLTFSVNDSVIIICTAVAKEKGIHLPLIFASLGFREILHTSIKLLGVAHPKCVGDFSNINKLIMNTIALLSRRHPSYMNLHHQKFLLQSRKYSFFNAR